MFAPYRRTTAATTRTAPRNAAARIPRIATLALLTAAVALAGALWPGLPGPDPSPTLTPPPAHATHTAEVTGVAITSNAGADGVYNTGDTITIRVTWAQCVLAPLPSDAAFTINMGSSTVTASPPDNFSQGATIDFSYVVTDADQDVNGITSSANALAGTSYHVSNHFNPATCVTHTSDHSDSSIPTIAASGNHAVNPTDYDTDDDGLIEITTLEQVVAVVGDHDGDGTPVNMANLRGSEVPTYNAAFPGRKTSAPGINGCYRAGPPVNTACYGYELMQDLDFDLNGDGTLDTDDGEITGMVPWGQQSGFEFSMTFDGNGNTISNVRPWEERTGWGLIGNMDGGHLTNLGLDKVDASFPNQVQSTNRRVGGMVGRLRGGTISNCWTAGNMQIASNITTGRVGGLVGLMTNGTVRNSWSSATVSPEGSDNNAHGGGLVGSITGGSIVASYATGAVSGGGGAGEKMNLGGLVGEQSGGVIVASYATGAVDSDTNDIRAGGLIGELSGGTLTASYATGAATSSHADADLGGLVGEQTGGTINHSYWDTVTSEIDDDNPATSPGAGYTTEQLQAPTYYTGIYQNWNVDVDGQTGVDDPWHFGASSQYPVPQWGWSLQGIFDQYDGILPPARDYDRNNNGRIEVSTLAQLNAIRHDLNGSGADGLAGNTLHSYRMAFLGMTDGMGCPSTGCNGYELASDLDFADSVHTVGAGWVPFGTFAGTRYTGSFYGNGHTISNLYIRTTTAQGVGLFGYTTGGVLDGVGLLDVDIDVSFTASDSPKFGVGGLVGIAETRIRNSYATGKIRTNAIRGTNNGPASFVGGLAGIAGRGSSSRGVFNNWADVDITVASNSTNSSSDMVGGLLGQAAGLTQTVDVIAISPWA